MSKLLQLLFAIPVFQPNPLIDESAELTSAEKRLFKIADRTEQLARWNSRWILVIRAAMLLAFAGWILTKPAIADIVDKLAKLLSL